MSCLFSFFTSLFLYFFFSSRRRHTRYWRDWSSDVCSSDLQLAAFHRAPWQEGDLLERAELEHRFGAALVDAVAILHRHDRRDLLRPLHLVGRHVGEAEVPDLALVLQGLQRADRFFKRHLGIGAMKLVEIDLVDPQPLQAALARR